MGLGLYGTELNCYHKKRLGWITEKEAHVIKVEDVRR